MCWTLWIILFQPWLRKFPVERTTNTAAATYTTKREKQQTQQQHQKQHQKRNATFLNDQKI